MQNDSIQGIIFDARPVIRFRGPLTKREQTLETIKKLTYHRLKSRPKKRQPIFATDRMPGTTRGSTRPSKGITKSTSAKIVLR